jgi:hypothetical protein
MPRMVTLFIMILVLLTCSKLVAADNSLSVCVGTATKLEGRGKVGDKDLIAAHQACMRAKARARDAATRTKVGVATTILVDEYRRRAGSRRSH